MRLVTLICLLALAASALAFAPSQISFQGQVTENGGGNVPDGNHSMTFRVYNQEFGGAPLFATTENVPVQGGIFTVILPIGLPFDEPYWIGVQYEAEAEMAPRVPFTSAPYAMNIDEDAAVTTLNGNAGSVNLIAGTNVSIVPSGNNFIIAATGAVADNDWGVSGNNMSSLPTGNVGVGIAPASTLAKLHVGGDTAVGSDAGPGYLRAYSGNPGAFPSRFGGDYSGEGGEWQMYDENSNLFAGLQPDFDGEGGFLWVYNGNFAPAFQVDGSYNNGSPRVTSLGNNGSVVFDLEQTGDSSVQLPTSSIAAYEMLNEPGLAAINEHGLSSYVLDGSYSVVTSRSITVPTDGYILATSSMEIELNHQGNSCFVTGGLSLSPNAVDNNQDLSYYLPSTAGQGLYLNPSSPTNVYPVSAGTHTVYLNASRTGTDDAVIWDAQLNLVFIPTNYGTVTFATEADRGDQDQNQSVSRPLSSSDIAAERQASERTNQDRMEQELAAMRAELDALRQELATQRNGTAVSSNR